MFTFPDALSGEFETFFSEPWVADGIHYGVIHGGCFGKDSTENHSPGVDKSGVA